MELSVWSLILIFTLSICLQSGRVFAQDDSTCLEILGGIEITKQCSQTKPINGSLVISVSSHQYNVIPKCQNCSVTIVAADDHLLVATLYKLGTEISNLSPAACDLTRLDIFDGNSSEISKILSDEGGICGCKLPAKTVFKSSGNSITVRLQTTCSQTIHGELELVVTSVKNELFNRKDCAGQFKCKTCGECVDKNLVCDGKAACSDKSDESDCKAHTNTCVDMFTCKNGQCIDKNLVCDGNAACGDESDESDCKIPNLTCFDMFTCKNGECIDKNLVCDGKAACGDESDESDCKMHNNTCLDMFTCTNGQCIDKNGVCDGREQCHNGSDEIGCHGIQMKLTIILLVVAGLVCVIMLVIMIVVCWKFCYMRKSEYKQLE